MKETLFSTCHTKGASFSNSQTNLLMSKETNSAGLVWRRMLLVCFLHKFSNSSSICFTTSSLTVLHNTDAFMMALQEVLNKPRAGIPTGILEPPTWDPALNPRWDPANPTRDPSYILDKIPHGIWPQIPGGIPPIPPGIPASFHAKSRQSHLATCFSQVGSRQSHLGSQICTM